MQKIPKYLAGGYNKNIIVRDFFIYRIYIIKKKFCFKPKFQAKKYIYVHYLHTNIPLTHSHGAIQF